MAAANAIRVTSISGALTVTFTAPSGATPKVYTNSALTTTVSLPATVTTATTTTFYFPAPGQYQLSVKNSDGAEIANDAGTTHPVDLQGSGVVQSLSYDTRSLVRDGSGDTGRFSDLLSATHASATYMPFVVHGATAGTARPASATGPVIWEGSVAPTNAIAGDLWFDTTNHAIRTIDAGVFGLPTTADADAAFFRPGVDTRSALELEGALSGPGAGRVMGIVVWDWGGGSLVWQVDAHGDITIGEQRHICGGQGSHATATSVVKGANSGAGAPDPVLGAGSTDVQGTILFGTGTAPARGLQVELTFGRAYASKPHVVICPIGYDTPPIQPLIDWNNHVSTTGFAVSCNIDPAASQVAGTYGVSYHVLGV